MNAVHPSTSALHSTAESPQTGVSIPVYTLEVPAVLAKQKPYQQMMREGVTVCVCVKWVIEIHRNQEPFIKRWKC